MSKKMKIEDVWKNMPNKAQMDSLTAGFVRAMQKGRVNAVYNLETGKVHLRAPGFNGDAEVTPERAGELFAQYVVEAKRLHEKAGTDEVTSND